MTTVLALGAAAAVTWVLRVLTVTIVPASRLPGPVQRMLPHVGPAVLAAIVATALLSAPDDQRASFVVAAAVSAVVAWRGAGPLTTVLVGLTVVALLDLL